jgi:HEAT repeat protein
MVVRTEALLAMVALKVITPDELVAALEAPDENLQCIAARTLVLQGQKKDQAVAALKKLVSSKDAATAAMARMALLGLGEKEHFEPLQALLKDPATSGDVMAILLEQVSEEKITAAGPLLEMLLKSDQPWQIKLRAFRAVSALSETVPPSLTQALAADGQTVFRVHLMRVLAWRTDSAAAVAELAKGEDTIATLARFEQARAKGGDAAGAAAIAVVKLAHPVVIDYLLDRARLDVKDKPAGAEFYIPALVQMIESIHGDPQQIRQEHFRAAKAATILADLATPKASDELKRLLGGKYTAVTRVVATGLLRSKNAATCDLMRPLLKSPYDELSTDAALLLGRWGDKDALPLPTALATPGEKHSSLLQTMAGWYVLKINGRSKAAAEELAKAVSK